MENMFCQENISQKVKLIAKKTLSHKDSALLRRFFVVWNKKGLTHRFQRFDGVEIACGSGFLIPRFGLGRIGSYTQAFGVHIA